MRNSTLLFLIKKSSVGKITDICLAMKKRGFGMGRWNGTGGKVNEGESIEDATVRETEEEIGVKIDDVSDLHKVAELAFTFATKPEWNQMVHVYFAEKWSGDIVESEEMKPQWFNVSNIPFKDMWPDDIFWLPKVLGGDKVKASKVKADFTFGDGDVILEQKVEVVEFERK